jgi:hypothetical protein
MKQVSRARDEILMQTYELAEGKVRESRRVLAFPHVIVQYLPMPNLVALVHDRTA